MTRQGSSLLPWLFVAMLLALIYLRDGPDLAAFRTRQATGPYRFGLLDWQLTQVAGRLGQIVGALRHDAAPSEADAETIRSYFSAPAAVRASQRAQVEPAIQRLVTAALEREALT